MGKEEGGGEGDEEGGVGEEEEEAEVEEEWLRGGIVRQLRMLRGAEATVLMLDADASPLVCVYACRCVGMCVCPCDAGPQE